MSKSDWAFLALNAVLLFWAFVGLASADLDVLIVSTLVAMGVSIANGVRILRNREGHESRENRKTRRRARQDEEMDARTVLDIDARLEALERREREMEEADRIRRMAARGEQTIPVGFDSVRLEAEAERVRS